MDFARILGTTLPIARKVTDPFLEKRQWPELDSFAKAAIEKQHPVAISQPINNIQRSVGARIGDGLQNALGTMNFLQDCCNSIIKELRVKVLVPLQRKDLS